MKKIENDVIESAVDCMCDMDVSATYWSTIQQITKICNENHVSWGLFTEIVEQIDHYMEHVAEIVADSEEFDDENFDVDDIVIQEIGV